MGMMENRNLPEKTELLDIQIQRQGATVRQAGIMPIHAPLVLLSFIKSAVMSSVFKCVSACVVGKYITPPQYFAPVKPGQACGAGVFLSIRRSISGFSSSASLVFSINITTLGAL